MNRTLSQNEDSVKLTVKDVLDAYSRSELFPAARQYLTLKGEEWCGCAISALYCANVEKLPKDFNYHKLWDKIEDIVRWANREYGTDNVTALLLGFDGFLKGKYFGYAEGEYYEIGRLAAQQLGLHKGNLHAGNT